jgi:hypothetical protein
MKGMGRDQQVIACGQIEGLLIVLVYQGCLALDEQNPFIPCLIIPLSIRRVMTFRYNPLNMDGAVLENGFKPFFWQMLRDSSE